MNFFKNKNGEIELTQKPNAPIILWFTTVVIGLFLDNGRLSDIVSLIGFGALIIWALLEIFLGISYFRRTLGLIVLVVAIVSKI